MKHVCVCSTLQLKSWCYDLAPDKGLRKENKGDFDKSVAAVVRMIGFKLCREITSNNETFWGGHLDP